MSGKLIIPRGLPGSGKSTVIKAFIAKDPERRARVSRDDARIMLHGDNYYGYKTEKKVNILTKATVKALLKDGLEVVLDETNLRSSYLREWIKLAKSTGSEVEIWDEFLEVPLEECQRRNMLRTGRAQVPPAAIQDMYDRYLKNGIPPVPEIKENEVSEGFYFGDPSLPPAVIVDIDGTIARNTGGRGYYDWHRVGEDTPIEEILEVVHLFSAAGYRIIVTTGRDAACRTQTEMWLDAWDVAWDELYMRPEGDQRKDSIVKAELFDRFKDRFNVKYVLDDRDQVVEQWRALGLVCFQVAPGDF